VLNSLTGWLCTRPLEISTQVRSISLMSRGNWILLILGVVVALGVYRNKTWNSKMRIKVWGELEGSLLEPNKQPEYVQAKRELTAYRLTLAVVVSNIVVALTNWEYSFISGPILLLLSGATLGYSFFVTTSVPSQVKLDLSNDEINRHKFEKDLSDIKKTTLIALAIVVVLAGNWEYRIQKDSSEQMQYATNEALDLVGTGWCSNFWDIKAEYYPEVEPIKTGGWPCINIGSVTDVRFTKIKSHLEMCFSYSLTRSDGLPSQDSIYEYDYKKLCSTDSWYVNDGGWSTDSLRSKIYEVVKSDLDELQVSVCRNKYFLLSEEERIVYC
jgi:hypothetical protein